MVQEECDVVIAGARLAGACAASHLARDGHRVVVLDKGKFPSDQLSTHLLFPSGIDELRRMGALEGILALNPTKSPWVRLDAPTDARLLERWRAVGDIDYSICVPRPEQDLELVRAARASGADVRERCEVLDVLWRGGRACGLRFRDADGELVELRAKLVVGADGRRSTVAAKVGAFKPYRASKNGRGLVFRYLDDPAHGTQDGETTWQFRDGDSFGFTFPSAPEGRVLALFMGAAQEAGEARRDPEGYWERKLDAHPRMRERLRGATNASKLRSTGDTSAYFRASSGPGWALVGDAGHFKDPVIGQGQRDALRNGRELAEHVTGVLHDPAALDVATRRCEAERDQECLPAYHFGNLDTRIEEVSPVLVEIFRRASANTDSDVSDVFGRARTLPQVVTLPRMALGLADALARGTGGSRLKVAREALTELAVHLRVRRDLLDGRFRSTRLVAGSDHPDPQPPAPPREVATADRELVAA